MIDKEKEGGFLDVIVCIGSPTPSSIAPLGSGRSEFDELIRY